MQGARVGSETVTTTRSPAGWQIRGGGELAPPIDLVTTRFELDYGPDWQPLRLAVDGSVRGQSMSLATTFGLTSATTDLMQGGRRGSITHQITPRTVVLPNNVIGAYEGLAARLATTIPGARLAIYIAPEGEFTATVMRVTPRRVITPDRTLNIREFDLILAFPSGPAPVQIWIDDENHLARAVLQASSLVALRDDLSSVLTRVEKIRNAGDEDVFIPVSGFNLGATITKPMAGTGKEAPAVILVAGSGPQDRDYMAYGVPIFGQLARTLSEAGYFVVRYDRRGSGQSGGRTENAAIRDYATDVVNIVRWLRQRDDVDDRRIAVLGYGEGGAVALVAADRESRIRGVGLLAVAGTTGMDATLEQQQRLLERMGASPADQEARIGLQQQILGAVVSGRGWDKLPATVRRQADTPWFKSWLEFDPAAAIKRVDQPILVLHGGLDAEVPVSHADQLEAFSLARKRPADHTEKVVVPGVNHLFTPATTGGVDEYQLLPELTVSDEVGAAIVKWLAATLPPR